MAGRIVRTGFPGIYPGEVLERLVSGIARLTGTQSPSRALEALVPVRGLPAIFDSPLT
jgi:hypothetical protein